MTETILDGGIALIQWLETFRSPVLNTLFLLLTDVGSTIGYLVMLPILWWGVSWKLGVRLFVALVLSVYINVVLKDFFELPRPFLYAEVTNLRSPDEYSFPSGHAQSAAVFWGLLALHFRQRWFTVVAAAMAFLVGFSRVYLGVHFPSDVLVGWTLGALVALTFARWSGALVERAEALPFGAQWAGALVVPALLTVVHPAPNSSIAMGALAGALAGLAFAQHQGLYPTGAQSRSRRAWLLVGLVGLPVLYLWLRRLSPGIDSPYYHLYLWARFAAIGLWVSFLVPRLVAFVKYGVEEEGSREDADATASREI